MYGIQTRAIPVQVECDDPIGGPFGQGLVQVSSRVLMPWEISFQIPTGGSGSSRTVLILPAIDRSSGLNPVMSMPRNRTLLGLPGPPRRWMIASASFLMPCDRRSADPMFLQIRSIRPLPGRSFREKVPEAGACDATMANLRISHTRSRSSTSIMDCICLLNCLLPFMPLIILRLLFH